MSDNKTYDLDLLWNACNHGLDYFHEVYPHSQGCENKNKFFKIDDENTASIKLGNKTKSGVYQIYDYRDKSFFNPIDHYCKENNVVFLEAVKFLFNKYGIIKNDFGANLPIKKWTNDTNKTVGNYSLKNHKKTQGFEFFAPFLTPEICKAYNFVSLESFEVVKEVGDTKKKSLLTVNSTDSYPIFAYNELKEFAKIYEPKAQKNKDGYSSKHHFLGIKPERYIYGWSRLFEIVDLQQINYLYEQLKNENKTVDENPETNWSIVDETIAENKDNFELIKKLQLDAVFIATGGSDGLNLASLGYNVIWFNSEAEIINSFEYNQLSRIAKNIYYVPDNDKTGITQAVKIGLQYLKIKIVWLPKKVGETPIKDFADWIKCNKTKKIEAINYNFQQILGQSLAFQFWEWNTKRSNYVLNNENMINFLKHNGFYTYKIITNNADNTKEIEETRIVHIKNNIVNVVSARLVRQFVLDWIKTNYLPQKIYNMIMKSVYFSDNALLLLPEIKFSTKTGTIDSQLYFFENKVVKITGDKIELKLYKDIDDLSWESNVIKKNISLEKSFFEIKKDENANLMIDNINSSSNYFKVLINTSRMFWQKDQDEKDNDTNKFGITSPKLTFEENRIQQLNLINKIYCVGYMLHQYKQASRPYFVLGIDAAINKTSKDANGGSGKSFLIDTVKLFLKNIKYKDGKEMLKEDPKFMFDGVTAETNMVFMDDLEQKQDYKTLFSKTTGVLIANHKGGKIYTVMQEDSPKFCATTNYVPDDLNEAMLRRLLFYQCSSYYHQKTKTNGYAKTVKISDSFNGKDLFDDNYSSNDYNLDYNFMMQCLQFYLSWEYEKVDAPDDNLVIRNLKQKIGDVQYKITTDFFDQKDEFGSYTKRDVWFLRSEIQDDYNALAGKYAKTPVTHNEGLQYYCELHGWELQSKKVAMTNPTTGKRGAYENYFVNSTKVAPPELINEPETNKPEILPSDDLPF